MPDITDIIRASIADASDEPAPDTSDDTGAEIVADPVVEETPVETAVVADPVVAEVKTPAEVDELAAELEALGIKAPKEGERENRLPYSRVKKIIANSRKKLLESHTGELKTREEKLTAAEKRLVNFDAADNLSKTDPDRYMQILATINPAFKKYLDGLASGGQTPAVKQVEVKAEPAPGPDATFTDGTKGYSAEGLEKLREWDRRQAVAEAQKLFDARLGPIEKANKEREAQLKAADYVEKVQKPQIRNQIATASKTWGKAFDDDYAKQGEGKSEILKYMQENPTVPFDTCVAHVLLPKVQANRDTMRADLLKEINARPKAAVKTPVAAVKVAADPNVERTTEDVIRESIAGLKR